MMKANTILHRHSGFTLMELLIVIAIIAIVSAFAVPNVIRWRNNSQVNAAARDMYAAFQAARSEAVKQNMFCTIAMDAAVDGEGYDYIMFLEDPETADLVFNGSDTIIRLQPGMKPGRNFSEFGSVEMTGADFAAVSFRPDGLPVDAAGNPGGGSVFLEGVLDKEISLSNAGVVDIISG
ncbi:MAG: GspH/FimT family pseudopilin [Desulfosudaceae bacterium]